MRDVTLGVEHPVVIISVAVLELDEVVVVDIFAYRFRSSEVHRSIFDRSDFAGCHEGAVYRSIVISIYKHDVV